MRLRTFNKPFSTFATPLNFSNAQRGLVSSSGTRLPSRICPYSVSSEAMSASFLSRRLRTLARLSSLSVAAWERKRLWQRESTEGVGCRVSGVEERVSGFGCRVSEEEFGLRLWRCIGVASGRGGRWSNTIPVAAVSLPCFPFPAFPRVPRVPRGSILLQGARLPAG